MISPATAELLIELVKVIAPAITAGLGAVSLGVRLGRRLGQLEVETAAQSTILRAQSQVLEWQSRVQEADLQRKGSDPPAPRPRIATLPDGVAVDWAAIEQAAKALGGRQPKE